MAAELAQAPNEEARAVMTKQIEAWRATVARYESDPKEKDGRKELREMAKQYEHERDVKLASYHHYETASAALQIGIVMASAAVITGMNVLAFAAGGLGILGLVFMAIGLWAPHAMHFV
jgi:hypothetical protein